MKAWLVRPWTLAVAGVVLFVAGPASAVGADFSRFDLLPSSPGVVTGALGGLVNPAGWSTAPGGETAIWWNDVRERRHGPDRFGFALGGPLGFGFERTDAPGRGAAYDYQVGTAMGRGAFRLGSAFRWATGDREQIARDNGFALGALLRPGRRVSFGASGFWSTEGGQRLGGFDVGVRPLGTSWLTLFGDYALTDAQRIDEGDWSGGATVRLGRLVHVGGRVREDPFSEDLEFAVHVGLSFNGSSYEQIHTAGESGGRRTTTHLTRFNPPHRTHEMTFDRRKFEVVNLERKLVTYRKDAWFDDGREAWFDLSRRLQRARQRDDVSGVLVNLAGTRMRPSIAWELGEELARFQAAGKKVLVHFDRASSRNYAIAARADRIVMDPMGRLELPGLALRRTYVGGALEKLGVGFQELRYFTYKSAMQGYARKDMSEADREQYARIVDVVYEEGRHAVTAGRDLTDAQFDALVDDQAIFTAGKALESGLVDTLARWSDVPEMRRDLGGRSLTRTAAQRPFRADEHWGPEPVVSVVYTLGASALDEGIRGRATSRHVRGLASRPDVEGVLLRVDSPGGDPMAADLIVEALGKVRDGDRPVVVSQGDLAASAGYSLSLAGSPVLATPVTITGSIGVISAWAWDDGLGEKIGYSADGVQRGIHADLLTGIRLPLGIRLPERPLTAEEESLFRAGILSMYDEFVARVAEGRDLPEERVREIAEGRVWMGDDARERGLVDRRGTLNDAFEEVLAQAELDPDGEWRVEEYPPRRRFSLPSFTPELPSLVAWVWPEAASRPAGTPLSLSDTYLKSLLASPGEGQMVVPRDLVPDGWGEEPE